MVENDPKGGGSDVPTEGETSGEGSDFLGPGPEKALEINPSAEEAFSPRYLRKNSNDVRSDSDSDDETEPLELDPDEVLQMNSSAEEAFSSE